MPDSKGGVTYLHLNLGGALLIFTFAARNLVDGVKKVD
jgi:hypothetical protein